MTRKALSTFVRSKRRLLEKSAVALLVATLFFYQQLGSLFRKQNLFYFHWELSDAFAILLLIVLLAAGAVVIRILLDSMGWQRTVKIYNHFFLLILAMLLAGEFVVQLMHEHSGGWARLCYLTLVGVIGFSLGFVGNRLVPYAKLVCLVFSPFVAIIFCQVLLLETWGTKEESRNTLLVTTSSPSSVERRNVSSSQQNRFPILFVVFDAWSSAGSMEDGRFLSHFTHLSELSDRSLVFSQAHSPGHTTQLSIPSILYQAELDIENEKTGFWDPEKPIKEPEKSPGLFELAKQHGYQTALVGYYFPYRKIFGDHLDYNFSRSHVPKGSSISESMLVYLVRNFSYLPDPLNIWELVYERLNRPFYSQNWFNLNKRQLDELLWLIDNSAANTFSFVHFAFPHRPYVFRADGTYFGHSGTDERGPSDLGGYRRHLEFLDLMIGRITESLHVSGKFNKTLLIVTADHGIQDPTGGPLDPDLTRVPLIVKLPGQERGYTVDEPFTNNRLKPLIEQVLRGEVDEEGWLTSIEDSMEVHLR
jgi:hypothetical protein